MRIFARTLVVALVACLASSLPSVRSGLAPSQPARAVYLARGLSEENLLVLGAALSGRDDAIFVPDSEPLTRYLRVFLQAYHPERVVPVVAGEAGDVEGRLGVPAAAALSWKEDLPERL